MDKKHDGKTLLCRTPQDGKNIAGRISFLQENVHLKRVGFEDFVHFERSDIIPLQLEGNQFRTVKLGSTSPGSTSTSDRGVFHLDGDVRQAIIGFRPWHPDDLVQEFHFKLFDTDGFLVAPDIESIITRANLGSV